MKKKADIEKAVELILPVIDSYKCELVEHEFIFEFGHWVLRLYVEKIDGTGVTIDDCAKISRDISAILDVEDVIEKRYSLEVSSPGLNRPLRKAKDFIRFAGKEIKLKTIAPIDGRGNYRGELLGMRGNDILMKVDGVEYLIPLDAVAKARIDFKF